jgi:hypothetical protein
LETPFTNRNEFIDLVQLCEEESTNPESTGLYSQLEDLLITDINNNNNNRKDNNNNHRNNNNTNIGDAKNNDNDNKHKRNENPKVMDKNSFGLQENLPWSAFGVRMKALMNVHLSHNSTFMTSSSSSTFTPSSTTKSGGGRSPPSYSLLPAKGIWLFFFWCFLFVLFVFDRFLYLTFNSCVCGG